MYHRSLLLGLPRNRYGISYSLFKLTYMYADHARVAQRILQICFFLNLKVGGSMHWAKTRLYSENTKIWKRWVGGHDPPTHYGGAALAQMYQIIISDWPSFKNKLTYIRSAKLRLYKSASSNKSITGNTLRSIRCAIWLLASWHFVKFCVTFCDVTVNHLHKHSVIKMFAVNHGTFNCHRVDTGRI